jgi:hypothetical protein
VCRSGTPRKQIQIQAGFALQSAAIEGSPNISMCHFRQQGVVSLKLCGHSLELVSSITEMLPSVSRTASRMSAGAE